MKAKKWAYYLPVKILMFILLQVTCYLTIICTIGTYLIIGIFSMGTQYYTQYLMNEYKYMERVVSISLLFRYAFYPLALVFGVLSVVIFLFLIKIAGHHKGQAKITAGKFTAIPLDLLMVGIVAFSIVVYELCENINHFGYYNILSYFIVAFLLLAFFFPIFCMSIAIRAKLGLLWKNTVIYRICKAGIRMIRWIFRHMAGMYGRLPILGKVILPALLIMSLELFVYLSSHYYSDFVVFLWLIEKIILIPLILICAISMHSLLKGGEALANGQLGYRPDLRMLRGDFRKHANNLYDIGGGMNHAVEERMKSERLKTELISNVSRDIEAPLNAIVSYTNQIIQENKEDGEYGKNERIEEYTQILCRHSERMKRLARDLLEVSAASSGTMEVQLYPCNIAKLLNQALDEFEGRFKERQLELIVKQSGSTPWALADSRLLMRVYDNLLNNICKYAQINTRVYVSVEHYNDMINVIFKNISAFYLDVCAEDLTERFVRGDKSRNIEGSGLGLSIARSLTELQDGGFALKVEGDLFKATLTFRSAYVNEETEAPRPEDIFIEGDDGGRAEESEREVKGHEGGEKTGELLGREDITSGNSGTAGVLKPESVTSGGGETVEVQGADSLLTTQEESFTEQVHSS